MAEFVLLGRWCVARVVGAGPPGPARGRARVLVRGFNNLHHAERAYQRRRVHRNEVNGPVHGHVVQAIYAHGGVYLHQSEPSTRGRTRDALRSATVSVGPGKGVRVVPGIVLPMAFQPEPTRHRKPLGNGLALIHGEPDDRPFTCVSAVHRPTTSASSWTLRSKLRCSPPHSGDVCGVLDEAGDLVAVPAVPERLASAGRSNHQWLEGLSAEQLRAGRWLQIDQTRFDVSRGLAEINRSRGIASLRDLDSDRHNREKATHAAHRLAR